MKSFIFVVFITSFLSTLSFAQYLQTTYGYVDYATLQDYVTEEPVSLDVEPVTSDNYKEITCGTYTEWSLPYYAAEMAFSINNGSGSFTSHTTFNNQDDENPNEIQVHEIKFGELRSGQRRDLAVTRDNRTEIYRNANNTLTLVQSNLSAGVSLTWGDYNGDGYEDLCVSTGSQILIYRNLWTGYVTSSPAITINSAAAIVEFAKINNDNYADLVYSNGSTLYTRKNNGGTSFNSAQSISFGEEIIAIESGDITGDNYLDVVASGSSTAKLFTGTTNANLNTTPVWTETFYSVKDIDLGDMDNDGLLDVVAVEYEGAWSIYLNTGSGNYYPSTPDQSKSAFLPYTNISDIVLADVENTGGLSLIMGQNAYIPIGSTWGHGVVYLFKHDGDPAPVPPQNLSIYEPYLQNPLLSWDSNNEADFKEYKVYRTGTDYYGPGWHNIATTTNTSYPDPQVYCGPHDSFIYYKLIAVDDANNYSDYSNTVGIWVIYKPPFSGDDDGKDSQIPTEYSIKQNYPNPFNPVTNIIFGLPQDNFVNLVVYNINGEKVVTLVNEQLAAGSYTAEFDGSSLPSGVYIYKIQAGSFSQIKRMLLIK
jgi:hypothetical protein